MQNRGAQRLAVHALIGQNISHGQWVGNVGLPGIADLSLMR